MRFLIPDMPEEIGEALQARAKAEGRSVDQAALDILRQGLTLTHFPGKRRDLSDVAGTWVEDAEFDKALEDFERVEPEDRA